MKEKEKYNDIRSQKLKIYDTLCSCYHIGNYGKKKAMEKNDLVTVADLMYNERGLLSTKFLLIKLHAELFTE